MSVIRKIIDYRFKFRDGREIDGSVDEHGIKADQCHVYDRIVALARAGFTVTIFEDGLSGAMGELMLTYDRNGEGSHHHISNPDTGKWVF